jgi:hypothetical protein
MDTIRRGEIAGILCLIALVAMLIVTFVSGGAAKSVIGDLVALVIYLFVCVTYFVFLLAIQTIAKSVGDAVFVHRIRDFLAASIIGCLFMAPLMTPLLLPDSLEKILVLVSVVVVAILGIVSIRIAPSFDKLEGNRAEYGRKAARWLKISGWLMATVILSFIGIFVSLIADFYMWRLVKQERLNAGSK